MLIQPVLRPVLQPVLRSIFDPGIGGGGTPIWTPVSPPAGFGWTPPVNVLRSSGGEYTTDYDPTPFLVEGEPGVTTFYIDAQAGNDANPGTAGSPKKSFYPVTGGRYNKLLLKVRGKFYRSTASYIQYGHDNLCVEAWDGADAILTTETDPDVAPFVWTSEGSGAWSAPWPAGGANTPNNVYAGTVADALVRLAPVGSTAECLATPSSFCPDWAGGKQWVHTADGASPATGHTLYGTNNAAGLFVAEAAYPQRVMYVGIQFRGGNAAFSVYWDSAFAKTVEFVGCTFMHANNFGALHCSGTSEIISYGCTAGPTVFDGFSYSTYSGGPGGNVCNAVEIDCIANNSGWVSTGANQGSTTHFGGKVVRVNGTYAHNADDQVADVGAGSRSWNLGLSVGPKRTAGRSGFQCGNNGNDVIMWLDGCAFTDVTYEVNAEDGASAIYYRNMATPTVGAGTGTVTTY